MKTSLAILFSLVLSALSASAQVTVFINPVPVTNGVTGLPADNTFVAGLYYAPGNASEQSLILLAGYSPLSGGHAFSSSPPVVIPSYLSGPVTFQVRGSSGGYTYETALASGLPSV